MKQVLGTVFLALVIFGLQSCGGGGGSAAVTNSATPAQGISSAAAISVVTAK